MITALFLILTTGVCIASLAGFVGEWAWLCEVASHFRVQYFFLLTIAVGILVIGHHYYLGVFVASLAIINLWCVVALYIPSPQETVRSPDGQEMRIVSLNVRIDNRQREKILDFVHQTQPDFLVLSEVSTTWGDVTQQLRQQFKASRVALRGHFGVAFFSQYPVDNFELKEFYRISVYAFIARVTVGSHRLHIIGAHLLPPLQWKYYHMRNTHLADLAALARKLTGPVMLIGDLNVTPWSPYFRTLLRDSGLRNGRQSIGILATWPVRFPPLRIPIDHCLVSSQIEVIHLTRGVDVGSDHFPLVVDFVSHTRSQTERRKDTSIQRVYSVSSVQSPPAGRIPGDVERAFS